MQLKVSILLVCSIIQTDKITVESARSFTNDYSWRDYLGVIPDDALEAGRDVRGNPIYIGQVLYQSSLVVGKVYTNDPKIYYEWYEKELTDTKNIKIFCTQEAQKFEWIATDTEKVAQLTNKIVVSGGYEPGVTIYIGRAFVGGETIVGKVVCRDTPHCEGLFTTSNGVGKGLKVFEILTINPDVSTLNNKCNERLFLSH